MSTQPTSIDPDVVKQTATALRNECKHAWELIGCMPAPSGAIMLAVRACFQCSSYTYHELQFVGYRDEQLEDRISDSIEQGKTSASGTLSGQQKVEGPPCEKCGKSDWRYSERFEDIRVCKGCDAPQLYRRPKK